MAKEEKPPQSAHWLAILAVALAVAFIFVVAYGLSGIRANGSQINVEYFFRLLYNCLFGACYGGFTGLSAWFATLWIWVIIIGSIVSVLALIVIVYATVRLFELREDEEKEYGKLILAPAAAEENKRWLHIQSLAAGSSPSDWRQAIIEADIMLDNLLTRQGYLGVSIGDKLKSVEPADFDTLDNAWEAHKVRNQIAHEGSAFDFSETLARRTLARYEAVFREFDAL